MNTTDTWQKKLLLTSLKAVSESCANYPCSECKENQNCELAAVLRELEEHFESK
jgi:hypothetical protein